MDKATFRKKLIEMIDTRLAEDDMDDELTFSEFWEPVRDHVDEKADDEDIDDMDEGEDDEDSLDDD